MSQVTYLPRPPTLRYPHQNCHVGWGPDVVDHAKFHQNRFGVLASRGVKICHFPMLSAMARLGLPPNL